MSDDLTVLGPDGIRRSYDEHYDTMMAVEQDPTGAHQAIQRQHDRIEELEKRNASLEAKLKEEIRISNLRGSMIDLELLPNLHDTQAELKELEAKLVRYDDLVADKINLRSENADIKAKLAKAVDLLSNHCDPFAMDDVDATTLAELIGGKDG